MSHELHGWIHLSNSLDDHPVAAAREFDIEDHHLRHSLGDQLDGAVNIVRLTNDVE